MTRAYLSVLLGAALLAGACASRPAVTASSPAAEPLLPSAQPTSSPSVDTSRAARPAAPPRAILIDDDGSGMRLRARPIDPRTLADVPGYEPISFDHHYVAATSPDGAKVAAILWPSGSNNGGGKLHLIDPTEWTDRALGVLIDSYASALRFDAAGKDLFWAQSTISDLEQRASPARAAPQALFRYDLEAGRAREIARFPEGFFVRDVQVAGPRIAVYAEPNAIITIDGKPRDVPSIFLVDLAAEKIATTVRLPMRAGQVQDPAAAGGDEPFRSIEPGFAWDLPRDRVFVADAESDGIATIDLRTGEVRGPFVPRPRRSMIDVLWSLFGNVAAAKMVSANRQQAAVSPDGTRLFVSGVRSDFAKGQDGKYHEVIAPLALRVIDTTDMSEMASLDAATTALWISPDGGSLLYGTNRFDQTVEGYANRLDFKLTLVNVSAPNDAITVPVAGQPRVVGFEPRLGTAYLSVQHVESGMLGHASLSVVDLASRRIVATRDMERHVAEIVLLGPR